MTFLSDELTQFAHFCVAWHRQIDRYGSVSMKEQLHACVGCEHRTRRSLTAAAGCLAGEAVQGREDAPAKPAAAEGPGSVHQGAALAEEETRR